MQPSLVRVGSKNTVANKNRSVTKPGRSAKLIHDIVHVRLVQTKLEVSSPQDVLELEAEKKADEIIDGNDSSMSISSATSSVNRDVDTRHSSFNVGLKNEDHLQYSDSIWQLNTRLFENRLDRENRGGRSLPDKLRSFMETRFNEDFSSVKIHTDQVAGCLSSDLNAKAFTAGDHIYFGDGQFDSDSNTGKHLVAHELTHVVQQRGGSPSTNISASSNKSISRLAFSDYLDEAGNFLADQSWSVVREYAPQLEPILRQGPLNWLKEKLASVFNSLVGGINRLNPSQFLGQLVSGFGVMLEQAAEIVGAMASGDCGPLFSAIRRFKGFVTETVGSVWNRVSDFLQPVGDFFSDIWSGFGAPAVGWIKQFAGDIWVGITQLGKDIWDWTRPVRDGLSAAWDWIKSELFGSDAASQGGSREGVLGWISNKAGEAWSWVKESTRSVWEPVASAVESVREMIPPAFVQELGESMQGLSSDLTQASDDLDGGQGVAENRQALANALPSLKQVLGFLRGRLIAAGGWVVTKVNGLANGFTGLVSRLKGSSMLSALGSALSWMAEAGQSFLGWAEQKVQGVFGWVVQGFDIITPVIEKIAGTVNKLIGVMGDLLQLPQLVLAELWGLIPECIRNPIKDFLINQVLSRIPVFSSLLSLPDIWARVQETAMRILRQIFVDGNIGGAAWTFFSSMLGLLGIPPELVVSILAKAASAIGNILTDPIGFLINILRSMKNGFVNFFMNIGTHLFNGVTGWLFGHMRNAGIEPPENLTLGSVFNLVLGILDITADRVFSSLGREIGPENVERMRRVVDMATGAWGWVNTMVSEGPGALWRIAQEKLSGLWNSVLNGVIGWVNEKVINQASRWLVSLLDPSGITAVVNSLIAVYRAIESFVEHIREMLEVINAMLDGVKDIAAGAIETGAQYLENALGRTIPIVLGFLANQFGLGNIASKLQEIIASVREKIDQALDWLISRAIRGGRAFLSFLQRGGAAVARGAQRIVSWWRARKQFQTDAGEQHTIYFDGSRNNPRLMIRSDPQTYARFIREVEVEEDHRADKEEAVGIAQEVDTAIAENATGHGSARETQVNVRNSDAANDDSKALIIDDLLTRLSSVTARFMPAGGRAPSTPPVFGSLVSGFGSSATVMRLTKNRDFEGSVPSDSARNARWDNLRIRKKGGSTYYIRGHLFNHNLGGTGKDWNNLTPLTREANSDHEKKFERSVKKAVNDDEKSVNFIVTANYNGQAVNASAANELRAQGNTEDLARAEVLSEEVHIPTSLDCRSHEVKDNGGRGRELAVWTVDNRIKDRNVDLYQVNTERKTTVYLNEMTEEELKSLSGVGDAIAKKVIEKRPFRSRRQLQQHTGIADGRWAQLQNTPGKRVRIFRRGRR